MNYINHKNNAVFTGNKTIRNQKSSTLDERTSNGSIWVLAFDTQARNFKIRESSHEKVELLNMKIGEGVSSFGKAVSCLFVSWLIRMNGQCVF